MSSGDETPVQWNERILFRLEDLCLIAIVDGKLLQVDWLDAMPPWRAVMMAQVAAKADIGIADGYTAEQLRAKAREVGGSAGPGWLTGREHRTCEECRRTSFDMSHDDHEGYCSRYPVPVAQGSRDAIRVERIPFADDPTD